MRYRMIEINEITNHTCEKCNNHDEYTKNEHTCPYATEILDDYESLCNCCEQCLENCAMEI